MAVQVQQSIFSEVAEFLASQPSLEALASYHVSAVMQYQIDGLLEKNSAGQLSFEERLELEKILAVTSVMDLAKTKANLKLVDIEKF